MPHVTRSLIRKIETLPPERVAEVEDFVDFLRQRDQERALVQAAAATSAASFAAVWDNAEDKVYGEL